MYKTRTYALASFVGFAFLWGCGNGIICESGSRHSCYVLGWGNGAQICSDDGKSWGKCIPGLDPNVRIDGSLSDTIKSDATSTNVETDLTIDSPFGVDTQTTPDILLDTAVDSSAISCGPVYGGIGGGGSGSGSGCSDEWSCSDGNIYKISSTNVGANSYECKCFINAVLVKTCVDQHSYCDTQIDICCGFPI